MQATLELPRASFTEVLIKPGTAAASAAIRYTASWTGGSQTFTGYEAFRREMDDWIGGITEGREPVLSGRTVVPVVALIDGTPIGSWAMT